MKFDFVDVFVRAAKITWKYKVLWLFGIFAGCNRSSGGNSNNGSNFSGNTSQSPFSPQMERELMQFVETAGTWFEQNMWIIFVVIAFVLISILLQVIFGVVGTAGLIRGATNVEQGADSLSFGSLFGESLTYFWRLFFAGIVIWLPIIVVFILLFVLAIGPLEWMDINDMGAASAFLILFVISLCCCMFPFLIAVGLYNQMVNRAIVSENLSLLDSLKRGWQVLKDNILPILGVGLALFLLGLLAGILISLPVLLPSIFLLQGFIQGGFTSWQPFINLIILSLCYTPIYWLLNGILTTYTETVWTLSYLGFTHPSAGEVIPAEPAAPNDPILA